MNKKLGNRKKGELRKQKLIELANSGKLAMIKSRGDLAEAVGFTYQQRNKAGYQWVKYKVDKGELKERLTGYEDGIAVYEYEYTGAKPEVKTTKKFPEPRKEVVERVLEDYDRLKQDSIEKSLEKLSTYPTLTIYRGETTIAVDNMCEEYIVRAIEAVIRQERLSNNG